MEQWEIDMLEERKFVPVPVVAREKGKFNAEVMFDGANRIIVQGYTDHGEAMTIAKNKTNEIKRAMMKAGRAIAEQYTKAKA